MAFIDIHGHYAWDIDDGMPSKSDAIKALEKAKENRISTIVATPHITPGEHDFDDVNRFIERINDLKVLARDYNIEVLEGCELLLNHHYLDALENHLFISMNNTDYLLVEFNVRNPLGKENDVEDVLYEIQTFGYTPIIAHVERYFNGELDLDRIRDFIDNDYVIQVNATSFLGYHGKTIQKHAFELLDLGYIHIIASDTHTCDGRRSPCLQDVFNLLLKKKYNYEDIHTLLYENPLHVIKNESVEMIEGKQSLFKRLFNRSKANQK